MGTGIDWERFSERVPAGARVMSYWDKEGILLENQPYKELEHKSAWLAKLQDAELFGAALHDYLEEDCSKLRYQPFSMIDDMYSERVLSPERSRFLINGQWLTFDEVMA